MSPKSDDFLNELLQNIQTVVDSKTRLFEYSGSETVQQAFSEVAEEIEQIKTLFIGKTETLFGNVFISNGVISSPSVMQGEPVIANTKLPVATVAEHVSKYGVPQTMENFHLAREQVLDACWYATVYGVESVVGEPDTQSFYKEKPHTKKWNKKWKTWAEESRELFEQSLYEEIPDPYSSF